MLVGGAVAFSQIDGGAENMEPGRLLGRLSPVIKDIGIVRVNTASIIIVPVVQRVVIVLVLGLAVFFQQSARLSLISNRNNCMAFGIELAAVESVDGQFR